MRVEKFGRILVQVPVAENDLCLLFVRQFLMERLLVLVLGLVNLSLELVLLTFRFTHLYITDFNLIYYIYKMEYSDIDRNTSAMLENVINRLNTALDEKRELEIERL